MSSGMPCRALSLAVLRTAAVLRAVPFLRTVPLLKAMAITVAMAVARTVAVPIALAVLGTMAVLETMASADEPPGPVVFSELMWAGSSTSSADEWIELYNRGADAVDLSGWTITRVAEDGADEVMVFIEAGILQPDGLFLIANYRNQDERSALAAAPQLVSTAVSLPNSKLHLRLYDGTPGSARLVDQADDGTGAPLGGSGGEPRAAMERRSFDLPGTSPEAWGTAEEASGWDPGSLERGTPGALPGRTRAGSDSATRVRLLSYSEVKSGRRR